MAKRPSKWVIVAIFVDGDRRYWAGLSDERPWNIGRGNAVRFDTVNAARFEAYQLKERYSRIEDVEVEEIVNPRARF